MGDFAGVAAGLVADAGKFRRGVGVACRGAIEEPDAQQRGGGEAERGIAAQRGEFAVGSRGCAVRSVDDGKLGSDACETGGGVQIGGVACRIGGAHGGGLAGQGDEAGVVVEASEFAAGPAVGIEDLEALGFGDGGLVDAGEASVPSGVVASRKRAYGPHAMAPVRFFSGPRNLERTGRRAGQFSRTLRGAFRYYFAQQTGNSRRGKRPEGTL